MEDYKIGVYVRTDSQNNIIEINSDIFIEDLTGWIKIDEGNGDKFAHAQSQYFDKPLVDDNGKPSFKLVDKTIYYN